MKSVQKRLTLCDSCLATKKKISLGTLEDFSTANVSDSYLIIFSLDHDEQKYSSTPYCVYASKKTKWNDQVDIGFVYWIMYLVHTHCFTYASAKRFRICTKTRKCEKMFSINKVTDKGRWGLWSTEFLRTYFMLATIPVNKVVSICQRLHTSVVVFRSVRQTVRMEKICTTRAFVEFDGHFVTFFSRNNKCCYDIFITVVAKFHWPIAFKGSMCCYYRLTNVALEDSFPKS